MKSFSSKSEVCSNAFQANILISQVISSLKLFDILEIDTSWRLENYRWLIGNSFQKFLKRAIVDDEEF